ncbi:MAG: hypothetical protein E5W28_06730, partial [Mesorhizobium sp.]
MPQVQIVGEMKRNLAEHQLYATLRVRTAEAAQIAGIERRRWRGKATKYCKVGAPIAGVPDRWPSSSCSTSSSTYG